MYIKEIKLINFRNYEELKIDFSNNVNIIMGNNAQGKTNLIESIYLSGFGKSFRTSKENDIININKDFLFVRITFVKKNRENTIEYKIINNKKKEIKINNNSIKKISDLLGIINIVIFSPDDLKLIKNSPLERRKFIDRELSQMNNAYCKNLIEYHKILNHRNKLLKQIFFNNKLKDTLDIWNKKLVEIGIVIIIKRREFIKNLSSISNKIHKNITNNLENLSIIYEPNIKSSLSNNNKNIEIEFSELLTKNIEVDIKRGYTSIGPHRDDISFFINDIDVKKYGSQGQQRTSVLSLKLSEIELIYNETKEYPILLLDDVMSELDINRQNDLVKTLNKVQTIITTTDVNNIHINNINKSTLFKVDSGKIVKI
ncbi:DNA replication/repair protein RecF [Helicovermis profundi]|uniref:DNA replication and repair protein RecF n=1 Tax=Helicovermis profundi TaxID=3065157 RepID=A0AAU9E369_9FIRM|nr:DNA replication/repair protein RecF [Clostridia bacterium S502]